MAMSGFICHDDYLGKTSKLTDEEVGRLFRALMHYHATGEIVVDGRESVAFDFIRDDIDRTEQAYRVKCEKNRNNRLSSNVNERKRTMTNVNDRTQKEKEKDKEKDKDIDLIDVDDARQIQNEQEQIFDAALDAGFGMNNYVRSALIALYADNGLEKVMSGIKSCVEHGAPNLAYLKACMKDTPKKVKTVIAQQFDQRDYGDEDAEARRRMLELMNA